MADLSASIHMRDLMRQVTMVVTTHGVTQYRIRTWVGFRLIKLAARIIGCGIRIDYDEEPNRTIYPDIGADIPGGGAF